MVRAHGTLPTDLSPRPPFPCAVLAAEIKRVVEPAARVGEISAVIHVPLVLVDEVAAVAEQLDFQVTVYQRVPWFHADLPSGRLRLEWPGAAVITPPFGRPAAPFAGPRRGAPDPDWRYRWGIRLGPARRRSAVCAVEVQPTRSDVELSQIEGQSDAECGHRTLHQLSCLQR